MCYISRPLYIADSLHFDFVGFRTIPCDSVTMESNCSYINLLFVFIQDNVYLSTPFKRLSQLLPVIYLCLLHFLATPRYDYIIDDTE